MTGEQLKLNGIQQALDSAERLVPDWGNIAFDFFKSYLNTLAPGQSFMIEEVREKSKGIVPEPFSKRAWGGIVVRAKNSRLIVSVDISKVTNPKAHRCWASKWQKAA